MTRVIPPATTLSEAWLDTLEAVHLGGGTGLHVVTTVTSPDEWGHVDPVRLTEAIAEAAPKKRQGKVKSIETVASTIFPEDLYRHQALSWHPDLDEDAALEMDEAALELYEDYVDMLPVIASDPATTWGSTYFGRMVQWPVSAQPTNQLAWCIKYLRAQSKGHAGQANSADLAIGGEGELASVQIHRSNERRYFGGPCLVHVDLSVHDGKLNLLATYRHWHLVERAPGNLLGLSRLLRFLCEQTGYPLGELTVVAGMANAQHGDLGGKSGVAALIGSARQMQLTQ